MSSKRRSSGPRPRVSLETLRQQHLARMSGVSGGVLDPDSNIYSDEEEHPQWWKTVDDNSVSSMRFNQTRFDSPVLDPDSNIEGMPTRKSWYRHIDQTVNSYRRSSVHSTRRSNAAAEVEKKRMSESSGSLTDDIIRTGPSKFTGKKRANRTAFDEILDAPHEAGPLETQPKTSARSSGGNEASIEESSEDASIKKHRGYLFKKKFKAAESAALSTMDSNSSVFEDALETSEQPQVPSNKEVLRTVSATSVEIPLQPHLLASVPGTSAKGEVEGELASRDLSSETSPLRAPRKRTVFTKTRKRTSVNFSELLGSESDRTIVNNENSGTAVREKSGTAVHEKSGTTLHEKSETATDEVSARLTREKSRTLTHEESETLTREKSKKASDVQSVTVAHEKSRSIDGEISQTGARRSRASSPILRPGPKSWKLFGRNRQRISANFSNLLLSDSNKVGSNISPTPLEKSRSREHIQQQDSHKVENPLTSTPIRNSTVAGNSSRFSAKRKTDVESPARSNEQDIPRETRSAIKIRSIETIKAGVSKKGNKIAIGDRASIPEFQKPYDVGADQTPAKNSNEAPSKSVGTEDRPSTEVDPLIADILESFATDNESEPEPAPAPSKRSSSSSTSINLRMSSPSVNSVEPAIFLTVRNELTDPNKSNVSAASTSARPSLRKSALIEVSRLEATAGPSASPKASKTPESNVVAPHETTGPDRIGKSIGAPGAKKSSTAIGFRKLIGTVESSENLPPQTFTLSGKSTIDDDKWAKAQRAVEEFRKKRMAELKMMPIDAYFKSTDTKKLNADKFAKAPPKRKPPPKAKKNDTAQTAKAPLTNLMTFKPKIPRPKKWATDRLYKFLVKRLEPAYRMYAQHRAEKLVMKLSELATFINRCKKYEKYEDKLEELMSKMARLKIIETRNDFHKFCQDYMPYSFRIKVIPMILPGNERNIPFHPETLHTRILDEA